MNRIGKIGLLIALVAILAVGALIGINTSQPVQAQGMTKGSHTVVMTDGTHLVVTDNKADMLYFYSIDKDAVIGSELKLRGKLDLSQVGKEVLTPVVMFKKEKKKD